LDVLALLASMHPISLDVCKERPQSIIAVEFNPFAVAQLPGSSVDMIEEFLPSPQQFHRFIERFRTIVKLSTGDDVLDKLFVLW
jgi:hypothetical protein